MTRKKRTENWKTYFSNLGSTALYLWLDAITSRKLLQIYSRGVSQAWFQRIKVENINKLDILKTPGIVQVAKVDGLGTEVTGSRSTACELSFSY